MLLSLLFKLFEMWLLKLVLERLWCEEFWVLGHWFLHRFLFSFTTVAAGGPIPPAYGGFTFFKFPNEDGMPNPKLKREVFIMKKLLLNHKLRNKFLNLF